MNFQGLKKVEDYKFYIGLAFRRANERSSVFRGSNKNVGTRMDKSRKIELVKIDTIRDVLTERISSILKFFPDLDGMNEFYKDLVMCTLDYPSLKKSLGGLNWANMKVNELHREYAFKIRKCRELERINTWRQEFYGRISSVIKQIKNEFATIENARRVMKEFPAIKTGMPTVTIAGFPNVGKTTLLFKLTGSKPDIQPYAFTTKGINVGYLKEGDKEIQVLDTPGTLNRFDKMNNIERVAFLAIKHLAEKIIYVFDITEPYPIESQVKLYESVKKFRKPVLVYLSKTDLLEPEEVRQFSEKYPILSAEQLKKELF